jgi:hypothetical protein
MDSGEYKFKDWKFVSVDRTNPKTGWSATEQRDAATHGDYTKFRSGLPDTLSEASSKEMYDKVRTNLGVTKGDPYHDPSTGEFSSGDGDYSKWRTEGDGWLTNKGKYIPNERGGVWSSHAKNAIANKLTDKKPTGTQYYHDQPVIDDAVKNGHIRIVFGVGANATIQLNTADSGVRTRAIKLLEYASPTFKVLINGEKPFDSPEEAITYLKVRRTKADEEGRYVTPFVSFDKQGDDQLQLIASLNASRLATWGFAAEAEVRGITRYQLTAVLDGRCCDFCQDISGKEFEVQGARRKVNEALQVQDPNDLKTVQPWPSQTTAALANYKAMSPEDLTDLGLNIPPYHPRCRCVCLMVGEDETPINFSKPYVPPEKQKIPLQNTTQNTFQELGIPATPAQVDHYNTYAGVSPVDMLYHLSDQSPQEILGGALGDKAIQFEKNGNLTTALKGVSKDVKYAVGTTFDPYSGTYYLTEADLLTGDLNSQKKFMKHLFNGTISTGQSLGAKSLVMHVPKGSAKFFLKAGFLPSMQDWLDAIDNFRTIMQVNQTVNDLWSGLPPDKETLLDQLFQNDKDREVIAAIFDMLTDETGLTEALFGHMSGDFTLDLTDSAAVAQAAQFFGEDDDDD